MSHIITISIDDSENEESEIEFLGFNKKLLKSEDDDCRILYDNNNVEKNKRRRNLGIISNAVKKPTAKSTETQTTSSSSCGTSVGVNCCVCFEKPSMTFDKFVSTLCGHIYCEGCIDKVFKTPAPVGKSCAVCRKKLTTKKSYHRLFLA